MAALRRCALLALLALLAPCASGIRSKKSDVLLAEGGVSDSLSALMAELKRQITMQEQAKADTISDRQRKEAERRAKERELHNENKWYKFWNWGLWSRKVDNIRGRIGELGREIASLQALEQDQADRVRKLRSDLQSKASARDLAATLEDTVQDLAGQVAAKRGLLVEEAEQDARAIADAKEQGEGKVAILDRGIAELAGALAEVRGEHGLLTETHSSSSCAEKEALQERICARCAAGTAACGDLCLAAGETCHHDAGCACDEAEGASLLQQGGEVHPLHQQIEDAKAEVRKVIAQHASQIDNFAADIATNTQEIAAVQLDKQQAAQEFDESIGQLDENLKKARGDREEARASLAQAEAELEQVTTEGAEAQAALAASLQANAARLARELEQARAQRADQLKANKEQMEALLDAQAAARNQLNGEIEELEAMKLEAQTTLDGVADEHL